MLSNPTFWVLIATAIFVGLAIYMGAAKAVAAALDKRGEMIAAELAEARRLREEASALLAAYESKRKAAEAEAAAIVSAAREEAERLAREAEGKLSDFVARRTKSAEEKIALAEVQAEAEVRGAAAEAATRAAEAILRSQVDGKTGDALFASGLEEVRAKLN